MEEKQEFTLSSFKLLSKDQLLLKQNDMEYKKQAIDLIMQKCKNEDFEYYRKVSFKGKSPQEINEYLIAIAKNNALCVDNMRSIYSTWIAKDNLTKSDTYLIDAFKKTNNKITLDNKIIETLLKIDANPNEPQIGKDLSMYVFGSQHIKSEEHIAWTVYEKNKNDYAVEKKHFSFFNIFVGGLLLLTIYMIFLRNNEKKVEISAKNQEKLDNNNENSTFEDE